VRTGVDFDRVAAVDGAGNIQTALTNAGGNSLIIASGTFNMGTMVNLTANQTLMGAGGTIAVRGLTSGKVANFTAAGATPTYNYTGTNANEAAFALAGNTHVTGLNMVGDGIQGAPFNNAFMFAASNTQNVHLTNLDLHNFYGGFVQNSTFAGTSVNNVALTMDGVVAHNDSRAGSSNSVTLHGNNNTVNIANSSFKNIRAGLDFFGDGNTISFDNVSIASNSINVPAILVANATAGGTSSLTVTNSHFDDWDGPALRTDGGTVNVNFSNSTINGMHGSSGGLYINTTGSNVAISNVTFTGQLANGIRFFGANNVLSGTGNVSTATYGNALCNTGGNIQVGSIGFTSPATTCP